MSKQETNIKINMRDLYVWSRNPEPRISKSQKKRMRKKRASQRKTDVVFSGYAKGCRKSYIRMSGGEALNFLHSLAVPRLATLLDLKCRNIFSFFFSAEFIFSGIAGDAKKSTEKATNGLD